MYQLNHTPSELTTAQAVLLAQTYEPTCIFCGRATEQVCKHTAIIHPIDTLHGLNVWQGF